MKQRTQDVLTEQRHARLETVNTLIHHIGSRGRRFLYNAKTDTYASFELSTGRLWYVTQYGDRIWTHQNYQSFGRARNFHDGGTIHTLLWHLKRYIWEGKYLNPFTFGPWPPWYSDGDPWGYGDAMEIIRTYAQDHGILATPPIKDADNDNRD